MNKYSNQARGALSEYEEYFAGMDASMRQKIALTTAHFPAYGKIADMGSGSGSGTFDLARLYRELELVGVDINPVTVNYSKDHYRAENLEFVVGDIADRVFETESLDGILDSSVLHHVTSFNDFNVSEIDRTLRNQVAQLKTGGVLIIRDFVVPDEAESTVFLDLPTSDGAETGAIPELSSAALFDVFARDFRCSLNRDSGVPFARLASPRAGFARFETTLRYAAEFVLRKDYRDHWAPELLEEYTYFSHDDFERAFRSESLRIVVSMPLWNPWIVENRFVGKFFLADRSVGALTFPPTNFLIVGEKVRPGEGVKLAETRKSGNAPRFLNLKFYRHRTSGQIFELAERPNQTIDLLPWFESESGQLFVLAKKDFPRPIVNAISDVPNLNRARFSGYITEPISALSDSGSGIDELHEIIPEVLHERAGLASTQIVSISEPNFYFTSPGGIDERVESHLVQISGWNNEPHAIDNYTKFKSAGSVRELDALQVLRASHVGGMFDARLEINIYRLLRQLGHSPGAWIGGALGPSNQVFSGRIEPDLTIGHDMVFEAVDVQAPDFLEHHRGDFGEFDSRANELARDELEFIVPKRFSKNTVAAIPFIKSDASIIVGIEIRDLPAPQNFTGNSRLACVPAWRLPRSIKHKFDLEPFVRERFPMDFRVPAKRVWELGGAYFTSAGITPEIVYPMAVEIDADELGTSDLKFIPLADLIERESEIRDAHLLVALNRLAHALGVG
ncbi:MAG: methyltransferase domain-containing protein [Acidobacteria bacterium]|nr:methyltransferase domain-containing protein [Acidobacteriota bacterium]